MHASKCVNKNFYHDVIIGPVCELRYINNVTTTLFYIYICISMACNYFKASLRVLWENIANPENGSHKYQMVLVITLDFKTDISGNC